MFTAFGPHAFEGRVLVARPDGTRLTSVLSPQNQLGYESAYGNSLKSFIVVSVTQSASGNNSVSNIVQYNPSTGRSTPLQQQLPSGGEGNGIPSPDNSKFVAEIGPVSSPQTNLWISDFQTKQFRQLTQGTAQDFNEAWSPDGRQLAFIRATFAPLTLQLMTVPVEGGEPTVLLGASEHVGQVAYSPDGKSLAFDSINGLETMDLATMQRKVILTQDQLHGNPLERVTEGFDMSWAKTQDTIVLILKDLATSRDQLWTLASDGSNLKKIYTASEGVSILSVTFVSN